MSGAGFLLATLVRPEAPLLHLAAGVGALLAAHGRRRAVLGTIVQSGALHAVGLALLTAGRLAYFGQPLPNTFYAKVGAVQLASGLSYLLEFQRQTAGWLWLPLLALIAATLARRGRPRILAGALLAQWVLWCGWLAVEGGGRWELRFFVPLLPGLALLVARATAELDTLLGARLPARVATALTALTALALVASQAATVARPFRATPLLASSEHLHAVAASQLATGRLLARYVGPDDRIATGWAGAIPYATDAWHLDTWGLNDREIARRPFDPKAPLYHQRHATWEDIAAAGVSFVDVYNRYLFPACVEPSAMRAEANPWIRDGVPVYCVCLPDAGRNPCWIFAAARPAEDIQSWLAVRGLTASWVRPFTPYLGDRGPTATTP